DSKVVDEAEEKFVGTWTFTPSTPAEKPAKVVHEFVSGTPDKELPQEVKALLPSGFDTKFDETVRPTTPTKTTVKVSDGTWTFTSYDENSKVVDEAEEKFVGTWTFTPKKPGGNTPGTPTPGNPGTPTPPTGTITVTPKAGPSQLPNTGEASTSPLYGVLSLVTGLAGLFGLVKKKKEEDQ
ncbi:TPA: LPXTG cell wall anchor domain-containing protein, partial [Streptococcus suis]|nr:LPXTG cell wall anchor domain-containing protein [Streptococcus suis]